MAKKSTQSIVSRLPNGKQLAGLVKSALRTAAETKDIRDDHSELVRAAVENGHVHKRALADVIALRKMGETQGIAARDEFRRTRDAYFDLLVEQGEMPKMMGDLAEQAEAAANGNVEDQPVPADDEQTATEAVVAENTAKLRRGIKKTEEGEPLH